jgi:hypothetical protein
MLNVWSRPRAHLPRPLLERIICQPEIDRRGDAAALCRALCAARRHAFRVQSVRGIFTQDAIDNKAFAAKGKLTMPVLAIGGDKSFGKAIADDMRFDDTDVASVVISTSGQWLMERAAGRHSRGHPRIPRQEVTMRRRLGRQASDLIQ